MPRPLVSLFYRKQGHIWYSPWPSTKNLQQCFLFSKCLTF